MGPTDHDEQLQVKIDKSCYADRHQKGAEAWEALFAATMEGLTTGRKSSGLLLVSISSSGVGDEALGLMRASRKKKLPCGALCLDFNEKCKGLTRVTSPQYLSVFEYMFTFAFTDNIMDWSCARLVANVIECSSSGSTSG